MHNVSCKIIIICNQLPPTTLDKKIQMMDFIIPVVGEDCNSLEHIQMLLYTYVCKYVTTLVRVTQHMLLRHMVCTLCARFLLLENVHLVWLDLERARYYSGSCAGLHQTVTYVIMHLCNRTYKQMYLCRNKHSSFCTLLSVTSQFIPDVKHIQ